MVSDVKKLKVTEVMRHTFLFLAFLISWTMQGQIPHGIGRPLQEGAEKTSMLRNSVDYFVEMPSINTDSARTIDDLPGNRIGGLRFACTIFTDLSPENAGLSFTTDDGTRIWKVGIRSNGAFTLNVLFSEFLLPEGASAYLYNPDRSVVLGPFTRENNPDGGEFSVAPVDGDELIVEYHEPSNAAFSGRIRITEVNHDYLGLFRTAPRFNSINMPCQPDVSCEASLDVIKRSTCLLIINGNTFGTGTFLNNTARDGKPYLITAYHGFNNDAVNGSRIVAFLNYESPNCDKRIRGSEEFSISGSVCRAFSKEVDFALMEFNEKIPAEYRPWLAGWSLSTETAADLPFVCIHHPNGDTRRYCVEEDSVDKIDYLDDEAEPSSGIAAGNHWYIRQWEKGHTWTGSSGSGLFDKNFRFRGGLTGGGSGGLTGCSTYTEGDYFFRIDRAWDQFPEYSKQLKHWLDPLTPDSVPSNTIALDGLDPYELNPARRINNLQKTDSLEKMKVSGGWGTITGHNSLYSTHFAEHFRVADSSMILGVYLIAGKGSNNTDKPIYVSVYEGGEQPGKILAKKVLNPNYTDYISGRFVSIKKSFFTNRENFLKFISPVSVGTDFYIGYEIPYPIEAEEDTFYLYHVKRSNDLNTAFFKQNSTWQPFTFHPTNPINTSLWIEAVVVTSPYTYYEVDTGSVISTMRPIVYWSDEESTLSVAFPDQWVGETDTEIFDLSGRIVLRTVLSPPIGTILFTDKSPRLYLIRLNNGKTVVTQKALIGYK
jgi:lysyl endopeptidase